MKTSYLFILTVLLSISNLFAQNHSHSEELRGAWVATVSNIDWPSRPGLSDSELRAETDKIISALKAKGFNTIFLQVKPSYGTMYPSRHEPFSKYLVNNWSQNSGYDPLEYWVERAHASGMHLHAWINPYRVLPTSNHRDMEEILGNASHRKNYVTYGKALYLDPGIPVNREYIIDVIKEIVENYNIDGVHFDDYFYPYDVKGEEFDDSYSFSKHKGSFTSLDDWRRNNVNLLIQSVHEYLTKTAPIMSFGVSPFGVWRNSSTDPKGSDTQAGVENYDDLYADVLLWDKEGWIDYIAPQLYWHIGFEIADYEKLAHWWSQNIVHADIYVGHAIYKFDEKASHKSFQTPEEIGKQIELTRSIDNIRGSIFYNTNSILKNKLGVIEYVNENYYHTHANVPQISHKKEKEKGNEIASVDEYIKLLPPAWGDIKYLPEQKGLMLNWANKSEPGGYMISRVEVTKKGKLKADEEIIANLKGNLTQYLDKDVKRKKYYLYRIVSTAGDGRKSQIIFSPIVRAR